MARFDDDGNEINPARVRSGAVYAASPVDKSDIAQNAWRESVRGVRPYMIGDYEAPCVDGMIIVSYTENGWDTHLSVEEAKATGRPVATFSTYKRKVDHFDIENYAVKILEIWE